MRYDETRELAVYFKRLELIGFKSFADRTVLEFEPGVTAVVGPNGCGKSNISDAIRWVLGEQSVKSLRGTRMEDVIFNGSSLKESVNVSEVSLTLSNHSKILPIDYEEVTITRRLYRSGESEYFLNKNSVRLRDIHELLMGTGIGTESYSLIEQGRMDVILDSKPEDRRAIFEEAAGITKYKSKKNEALRKLEQTQSNLLRVNDILQEVKRQIGSVERQAKKAEQHKTEFEKLKALELAVASGEWLLFQERKKTKQENLEDLNREEEFCLKELSESERLFLEKRQRLSDLDARLKKVQAEVLSVGAQLQKNRDRVCLNRERIGELVERGCGLRAQREASAARLGESEKDQRFLETVQAEFDSSADAFQEAQAQEEAAKSRLLEIAHERAHLASQTAKIHAEDYALGLRLRKLKEAEETLLKEIRQLEENSRLPLFEGRGRMRIQARIREFKEKILTILNEALARGFGALGAEEEARLDSGLREYTDDILKLETEDTRENKIEEKLLIISQELLELERERNALAERDKEPRALRQLLDEEEKILGVKLTELQAATQEKAAQKERLLVRLTQTRALDSRKAAEKEQALLFEQEIVACETRREALGAECAELEEAISKGAASQEIYLKEEESLVGERDQAQGALSELLGGRQDAQARLDRTRSKRHALEMENAQLGFEMDRLTERIFNVYQVDLVSAGVHADPLEDLEEIRKRIQSQREKLQKMGPVNLVALEEYDEMRQRFDFLAQQEQDLIKAKEDLHKAIVKINRTTRELFTETFQQIQKHFTQYYRMLFGGGAAELLLLDETDVLESGVEIVVRPPGKKLQSISLLSGGEKALTAIALLFAIFKVKPSPFCVLDEIDAPLDEPNIERFCSVLREFVSGSQFILITHNKRTMHLADALYGITMAQTGVSKIVSVRFSETNGNGVVSRRTSGRI